MIYPRFLFIRTKYVLLSSHFYKNRQHMRITHPRLANALHESTNIQTVLANKGCLSITDLESMTSANAACENIPSKNNGDCVENDGVTRCDQSTFWHDCYR